MDIYRARWIVPVEGLPIENGVLVVDGGRIARVSAEAKSDGLSDPVGAVVHDLGDCILLPGFVNAHTHLELTCYRGKLSPGPLWTWLERLTALRLKPEAVDEERDAVRLGSAESLASGVTCVGDISRTGLAVASLKDSPIRKVCFLELFSGASQPPNDARSLAALFEKLVELSEPPQLTIGISPHAVYSVTQDELTAATGLAEERNAPLTIHLLETEEEVAWLAEGTGVVVDVLQRFKLPNAAVKLDVDVMKLLEQVGVLTGSPLLAHVNYVTDDQIDRLAISQATVVWCPRAHRFFGHKNHRWRDMLSQGINVCIGTDSAASNESLSILDELREVRRQARDESPDIILEMGTIRGAAGLGLNDLVGSLKIGKRADFITIPLDPDGNADPILNLLDGGNAVNGVWVDGIAVVDRYF